jgi:diguanylate cyclase (GGDEF)-like protein
MQMTMRNILVVDDQNINRIVLRKMLSDEYRILEASDGQEAMNMLHAPGTNVSLILLDLVMPVMDGYTFLQQKQKDQVLSNIPVIVTTAEYGTEKEALALQYGANDFVTKPYRDQRVIKQRVFNKIKLRETAEMANAMETDRLTGGFNKVGFVQRAADIIIQNPGEKYDLVSTDIESFKLVNELHGTEVGDQLLRDIARWLSEAVEREDIYLFGRSSADVFLILMRHDLVHTKKIVLDLCAYLKTYSLDISLELKAGCYTTDQDKGDKSVDLMCDRADMTTKSIKGHYGEQFATYDDSLRIRLLKEQEITSNMQQALNNQEFVVYYQPKFNLNNMSIVGAEALVRWRKPDGTLVPPGEFIPLFELNGFITQVDIYVWERVCINIKKWLAQLGDKMIPISVNVSRVDIYRPHLLETLVGLVQKYEIPIEYLHLEITESAYTENATKLVGVVKQLHDTGFIIEMDDFGKGYSSLNMLSELPIDILKLDMNFMQNSSTGRQHNVLNFVVGLSKWLGLKLIAEGVETGEQVNSLRSMSCEVGQGYYYSKPIDEEKFTNKLFQDIQCAEIKQMEGRSFQGLVTREEIWNPVSLFNKFINFCLGSLVIYEYTNGKLIFVRGNKQYFNNIGRIGLDRLRTVTNILDLFEEKERSAFVALLERAQKENRDFVFVGRHESMTHPGQVIPEEFSCKVIYNMDGRTLFLTLLQKSRQLEG